MDATKERRALDGEYAYCNTMPAPECSLRDRIAKALADTYSAHSVGSDNNAVVDADYAAADAVIAIIETLVSTGEAQ